MCGTFQKGMPRKRKRGRRDRVVENKNMLSVRFVGRRYVSSEEGVDMVIHFEEESWRSPNWVRGTQ
jgi:hypothetical protein